MALGRSNSESKIGLAEEVRVAGKFAEALKLTRSALGNESPLSEEELKEIANNQRELAIRAAGARLIFGAEKSRMKRSLTPWQLHSRARSLMDEVAIPLYKSDVFRDAIQDVTKDVNGSPYLFDVEIARDIADYLTVLSLIFSGEESVNLIDSANKIWNLIIESKKLKLSDRAFFSLERNWFLFQTGNLKKIDLLGMAYDLELYFSLNGDSNLDRIATLADRALKVAQSTNDVGLLPIAENILSILKEKHSDYFENKSTEGPNSRIVQIRNKVMQLFAPTSGFPRLGSRNKLYTDAQSLGTYQQERLHADKSE
jgi:hypothetical protein